MAKLIETHFTDGLDDVP